MVEETRLERIKRMREGYREEARNFPTSPITIPTDREQIAHETLRQVFDMWEQGRHYESLVSWFSFPLERREDVVNIVLLQEAQGRSLHSAQADTRGQPANLVLEHYTLLTTDAVGKLVMPSGQEPITDQDVKDLNNNPTGGSMVFDRKLRSIGLRKNQYTQYDMDDFIEPGNDIRSVFDLEEARKFLLKLIPYIHDEYVKKGLLSSWGIVNGIKHADLLTDPRLTDDLETAILGEAPWHGRLANYLNQGVFPSPEFFEEAFKRLNTEDSDPNATFLVIRGIGNEQPVSVPAGVFYFTMLRRITTLAEYRKRHPEFGQGREDRIISYLLNDTFMKHALPYLETEEVYGDDFVTEGISYLSYEGVITRGEEAKVLKKERLGEVIKAAVEYAKEKGDQKTVQKLVSREVNGIKFSDYLSQ